MPVGHLYVFGEVSRSSAHFLIGNLGFVLNYMNCLCVLEIKHLSVTSFVNIFSESVGCSFHFVYDFLCYTKAYKFDSLILLLFLLLW